MKRWITVKKAEEETGLPTSFFDERTGASGIWPEGVVWKWFEGRKLIDLEALYGHIDQAPSVASNRGRRRDSANEECREPQPARRA